MRMSRAIALLVGVLGCGQHAPEQPAPSPSSARDYLYVWTASADTTAPDFLAVVDVTDEGARYGRVVATVTAPGLRNVPHHTEHEMSQSGRLFANGFGAGKTWIFDVSRPEAPRIAAELGDVAGYRHPHSYLRLPNGNVLATFQMRHDSSGMRPGGLVELTDAGTVVRSQSADAPGLDPATRVYRAGIVP